MTTDVMKPYRTDIASLVDALVKAAQDDGYAAGNNEHYTRECDFARKAVLDFISDYLNRAEKAEAEVAVLTSGGPCVEGCCLPDDYSATAKLWVDNFHRYKQVAAYAEQLKQERDDYKADYFRVHKDSVDRYEALTVIAARKPYAANGGMACPSCGTYWHPDPAVFKFQEEHHHDTCAYAIAVTALSMKSVSSSTDAVAQSLAAIRPQGESGDPQGQVGRARPQAGVAGSIPAGVHPPSDTTRSASLNSLGCYCDDALGESCINCRPSGESPLGVGNAPMQPDSDPTFAAWWDKYGYALRGLPSRAIAYAGWSRDRAGNSQGNAA